MIFEIILVALTFFYGAFLIWCHFYWIKIPVQHNLQVSRPTQTVSVIVPARNESARISYLLESLVNQSYPLELVEVLICDDHSTDKTFETVSTYIKKNDLQNWTCLQSNGEGKKNALKQGIDHAKSEIIITTDADSLCGKEWIESIVNAFVQNKAQMICGPVTLTGQKSFLSRLQSIEFAGLVGIGAASVSAGNPMICNGANLAFRKEAFIHVNGYENSRSSSGDDTQLLMKIHSKFPGSIFFLKDERAIVKSAAAENISDLISQRQRWASKIPATLSTFTLLVSILAWLVHAMLFIQFLLSVVNDRYLLLFLALAIKFISELIFLTPVARFLNVSVPAWLIFVQPFYSLYIFIIGLLVPFRSFQWKDRVVK